MRFVVYPYKMGSEASKLISDALDAIRVYPDRAYQPKAGDFIINWGNGNRPTWNRFMSASVTLLNHWSNVDLSISKIDTFMRMKKAKVSTPQWSTSIEDAAKWLSEGAWVCCRQRIEGKDGEGLVLAKKADQLVSAKLYTKYVPIAKEFRAYVVGNKMIDLLEKRRDTDLLKEGKVDQEIRTESRGWVFCRNGFTVPSGMEDLTVKSIAALGLDFGGVDVVLGKDNRLYTLETNTAPGVGGSSVGKFVNAFKQIAEAA